MAKSTDELLNILKHSENIEDYLDSAEDSLIETTLQKELLGLFAAQEYKPAALFRLAGIDKSYGYEILSGTKRPSRDKLIALLFALHISADDTQALLKATGYPPLYAKHTRDSVILFALQNGTALSDLNETLYDMGLELVK
ncbi:MAG: helix-turn-helix transcriptional regulator [Lachnospiraceae bacterium]|nr:helix-turn-helix transcriptional regulator [Lachnospiraceae bacterium]